MSKTSKIILITIATIVSLFVLYIAVRASMELARVLNNKPAVVVKAVPPSRPELLKLVNIERTKHGVKPLREDPLLDSTAQYKSDEMMKLNYFGHYNPDTGKRNGIDKMLVVMKNKCSFVSENLLWDQNLTSKLAVDGWITSKSHHDAMIDPRYDTTGFGISGGYVTEHFCDSI
jgi:uncharacterized protein YkwD